MNQKSFLFFLFFLPTSLLAQTRLWLGTQQSVQLKNEFQLSLWEEYRLHDGFKGYDRTLVELDLQKKLNPSFALTIPFRFTTINNGSNELRLGLQASKSIMTKSKSLINFRSYYQLDKQLQGEGLLLNHWRNKVDIGYKWLPFWQTKLENEFWLLFSNQSHFDRYRVALSNQIFIKKRIVFNFGFFTERQLNEGVQPWKPTLFLRFQVKM